MPQQMRQILHFDDKAGLDELVIHQGSAGIYHRCDAFFLRHTEDMILERASGQVGFMLRIE